MDCIEAKKLIDERVDELSAPASAERRDWFELDVHLSQCPRCATDWLELQRTRRLLADLTSDSPSAAEIERIAGAIRADGPASTKGTRARFARVWHPVAAAVAVAAVLAMAFLLGSIRYEERAARVASTAPASGGLIADTDREKWKSEPLLSDANGDGRPELLSGVPHIDGNFIGGDYGVADVVATSQPNSTNREFWMLVRKGDVNVKQFISPSANHASEVTDEINRYYDFASLNNISYGYQVPFGPNDTWLGQQVLWGADLSQTDTSALSAPQSSVQAPPSAPTVAEFAAGTRSGKPFNGVAVVSSTNGLALATPDAISLDFTGMPSPAVPGGAAGDDSVVDHGGVDSERLYTVYRPINMKAVDIAKAIDEFNQERGASPRYYDQYMAAAQAGNAAATQPATGTAPAPPAHALPQAKIIKTGELTAEVTSYVDAVEQVGAIVKRFNAFIADGATQEQAGGALSGRSVIRVVPEQFEALFAALKTIGRVEAENVKAADVTAEYVDLEARIHTAQISEERLQDLVKNKSIVDKISSLLEVERELARVRGEIEKMQGQL
ncbi:MAG TPA: DUF4349 domain-containing protein, partial [Phycisphaerae bacterium]